MFDNPLQKQQATLPQENLDALISFSPESVAYSAGYVIPSQRIPIRKRVFATIVTPERSAMVVAPVELEEARASSRIRDIRSYNEFADDPMQVIADALAELGVAQGRLGVEIDFLPGRHWTNLQRHLSKATLVDAEHTIGRMRAVKTQDEIERLRRVSQIVNDAHASLYATAQPGWTEKRMAMHLMDTILNLGGDGISLLVVGSGERSVFANCPPTDRAIRKGDVVRVDIYALYKDYLSDIARTAVVGRATPEQKEIWNKMCDAHTQVVDWIRPGVSTRDVMARFLKLFESMGLTSAINFVGHSLGLTLHEDPFFNLHSDHVVEEGMVFAIEPVHFRGDWGFHIEDLVLVTANGCEFLSDGRGELTEIAA